MKLFLLLLVLVAVLQAYIRRAPTDAARWHIDPDGAPDPGQGGKRKSVDLGMAPGDVWARLSQVLEAEPRSRLIAGGRDSGLATWEVRSAFWGFPDYVTVKVAPNGAGARLVILSRLRFGRSDLGVNAKRVARVVKALEQGDGQGAG